MGLDYGCVMLIKQDQVTAMWEYIETNGAYSNDVYECATLYFELDEWVSEYVLESMDITPALWVKKRPLTEQQYPQYITGNRAKIGCIYVELIPSTSSPEVYVNFTAATTRMSLLFQNSPAVQQWFIQLSRQVEAKMACLDLEEQGFRPIYPKQEALMTQEEIALATPDKIMATLLKQYLITTEGENYF